MFCLTFSVYEVFPPIPPPMMAAYSTEQTMFETFVKRIILSFHCLQQVYLRDRGLFVAFF